jgi:putative flippase GtrA
MTRIDLQTPIRFIIVGIANTLIGLAGIYSCKWLLGFGDVLSNICGYLIGLAASFVLNRNWTFRHQGAALVALARFLAVFALAYLLNLVAVLILIRFVGMNAYLAQAAGIVPYTVVFYLGSRYFAFRPVAVRQR